MGQGKVSGVKCSLSILNMKKMMKGQLALSPFLDGLPLMTTLNYREVELSRGKELKFLSKMLVKAARSAKLPKCSMCL